MNKKALKIWMLQCNQHVDNCFMSCRATKQSFDCMFRRISPSVLPRALHVLRPHSGYPFNVSKMSSQFYQFFQLLTKFLLCYLDALMSCWSTTLLIILVVQFSIINQPLHSQESSKPLQFLTINLRAISVIELATLLLPSLCFVPSDLEYCRYFCHFEEHFSIVMALLQFTQKLK